MTANTLSPSWRGDHAEPIDPDAIRFRASNAPVFGDCSGCIFMGQLTSVCNRASEIAREAGGFDCDEKFPNGRAVIYVAFEVDPRQLEIVQQSGQATAVTVASPSQKT